MTEDNSESKFNISCDECGHKISDEFIKKNQNQEKTLYCELCGAQINLKFQEDEKIIKKERKREIKTPSEDHDVRFSYTTQELRQEIINYVYKKIYELLKTTPYVIRRLKQQKNLKHFEKIKLAKKLRRILLYTSLPTHSLEQLTKISQKKIKNYFDNFKLGLKTKQKFQPKIHPRIIENVEFIYRLINGDFELSTLSIDNQKAVKNLLHTKGFETNIKTKNSFSYQLSLFICRQIYKKFSAQSHVSELLSNRNQLTKHYILNIAKDMLALILNDLLKRRFSRCYRTLKQNLELDWVYRESFINHICSLVRIVYKLTYNTGDKPKLNGFEKLIAEDLKRSKFFENDECFTPEFKLNLTLILCRIIYKIIESNSDLTSQEQRSKKLNILNKNKISNIILEEILAKNIIKSEFLKKFYKLSVEEFQKEYNKFQAKMSIDIIYKENFRIYLFQLIKIVNKITQWKPKNLKHTKIELAVIKDLSNYNFIWDNNQIDLNNCDINKKSIDLDKNNQSINKDTIKKQELSNVFENKTGINKKETNELKILEERNCTQPLHVISSSDLENKRDFKTDEDIGVVVLTINVPNFRKIALETFSLIINQINTTKAQRELILKKSIDILNEFILRAEGNEFTIQRHANPSNIAITIIYTVLVTTIHMPKISAILLERKLRVMKGLIPKKQYHEVVRLYKRYFENLYPRIEFRFNPEFGTVKNIISLYFYKSIQNSEIEISKLILQLKKNIIKFDEISFPEGMTHERIKILNKMLFRYEDEFNKYFSDLINVIQGIIIYSQVPMRIKAHFRVRPLVDDLYERDINLLHGFTNFYHSVIEIYDFLKQKFPDNFPKRFNRSLSKKYERQEYINIVGHRIKLYTIEHIHNGLYFIDGRGRCPKCYEEGLLVNTDNRRSISLEYHHNTEKKESEYSAIKMFQMYQKSRSDPLFLTKLIKKMEQDKVVLMCRVHHQIKHSKYFNYFKHLISWKDIYSLPAQLIYILIRISVNNHFKTKNYPKDKKRFARNSIISFLKKRYILERVPIEKCPTCQEFDIKDYLPAFDFNHITEHNFRENPHIKEGHDYINSAAHLFYKNYSCSEIAKILEFERGGFLCKNCHKVIDYSSIYLHLLEEIYEDEDIVKEIINDYNYVKMRLILFRYKESIEDPIKKSREINDSYEKYLDAFYELIQKGRKITHNSLANYLGIKRHSVFQFIKRNKSFLKDFVEINIGLGHGHDSTEIFLTERGKYYIESMYYIRDYYKSLKY